MGMHSYIEDMQNEYEKAKLKIAQYQIAKDSISPYLDLVVAKANSLECPNLDFLSCVSRMEDCLNDLYYEQIIEAQRIVKEWEQIEKNNHDAAERAYL